jgi:integrase
MRLADRTIAALPAPQRGQKLYTDDTIPGFAIRISQGGAKTFVLTMGANRQRITIGRYPIISLAQARGRAKTILAEKQLGITHAPSPIFRDVVEEYFAARQNRRPNTVRKDAYYSRKFKINKPINDIGPAEAERAVNAIEAPVSRFQGRIWLRCIFRFAEERGYIDKSPLVPLRAAPKRESRERVLTDPELTQVLSVARVWSQAWQPFGAMVELIVLTGQRRQQVACLTRQMLDFEARTITWPPECMKNGRRHTIAIGDMAAAILASRAGSGLFFASAAGGPFSAWSSTFKRFRDDCAFYDWTLHDLRRTMATRWQEMEIDIATTEKMLSHSAITGGLVGVYQRSSYLAQMRGAIQKWEDYLHALLSETEGSSERRYVRPIRTA